ncbi:prolyl-tRNA synthetase [Candidatus Saccharibacteria bacterium CG11_big_fil_rev_8_21_14_0_20_41_19]|nr:prolyl-tRNA synthetase [Candidatus Saccharibacteria bacterium]OIP85752.1 MAG: prolyl-tRNA synthetase [Candidatus Saccharibacteria bacterium CG2_30_41_52]PIQ70868.1 MAG: prolyl-tRNA synthetase [Candidatus Saccharibacteria bacterium CG11_big_fil_rev_8_21_14_0_20_41_19]PIZ61217.1 MAG: prolyl-tRNA synthetase [Candidatus Saccharibacteria bacterium CG_4_10_14_0_2_um_filter_41_11]PJC29657.1 MAG: prolyl-tRNA synthetase [Candidatus Saccharibacteria bacterium CG_4_9_14_0_2_um_filter_41_9]PJE65791.1 M
MRVSKLFTKTSKTAPADEVAKNAQLLIKAGFIHKEMAGVYAYMPLGLRVLENIKKIVREEMNNVGGQEIMMTTLQPKDIWEKTDRWDDAKVDNWFKTKLVNGTELGVGLTHEEPIVDAVSNYLNSYKDMPFAVYQIQNKFRNELRAKSGLLRGREFLMKDMYTFCRDQQQHEQEYEKIVAAYYKVYDRLGLGSITYRTYADGGIFTPRFSDEFQTISEVGEDTIYVDEAKRVAINEEIFTDENIAKLGLKREELVQKKGIEVGNTFHLETKYTDALDLYYYDEKGDRQSIVMGCYGIGVSRIMGVIAELFADDKGLVWPENIAPFRVYLVGIGGEAAIKQANDIYEELKSNGIEVIYDDRDVRPGQKFADSELIGIPYRVTVSDRLMADNTYELVERKSGEKTILTHDQLLAKLN